MFPAGAPGIRARTVVLAGGLRLRLAESGPSTAPPVLLLHGWGASIYMWRDWFAPLAAMGLRAIAVDLPGHGLSDKPEAPARYRLGGMTSVLRELLDAERLHEVDVVAQSMAGTIALEMVLTEEPRVRRLALVNPARFGLIPLQAVGRMTSPPPVDFLLPRLVTRWVVARAHRMVYGNPSLITARDEDEYWAPSQYPAYARAMRRLLHEFSWRRPPVREMAEQLARLDRPTMVVLGTLDRLVRDARPYAAKLVAAGAPLVIHEVLGGGHAVNEERPAEVMALVVPFLTGSATGGQHGAT